MPRNARGKDARWIQGMVASHRGETMGFQRVATVSDQAVSTRVVEIGEATVAVFGSLGVFYDGEKVDVAFVGPHT